jgi:hypothetical protein
MKVLAYSLLMAATLALTAQAASPLSVTVSGGMITEDNPTVGFALANPGTEAAITNVFDLQGHRVAELSAQSLSHFTWDGNDVDDQPVDPGFYVVQIRHKGQVGHYPVIVNR